MNKALPKIEILLLIVVVADLEVVVVGEQVHKEAGYSCSRDRFAPLWTSHVSKSDLHC